VEGREGFDAKAADVLMEELNRLQDKLRTPTILFYLEGRTQAQVAAFLGCDQSAVSKRLNKALGLLRKRLASRGMTVAPLTLAAWLGYLATSEAELLTKSLSLFDTVAKAAVAAASGANGSASPTATALATAVLRPQISVWWVVAGGLLALAGTGLAVLPSGGHTPSVLTPRAGVMSRTPEGEAGPTLQTAEIFGQVIGPDGNPIPHADVSLLVRRPWQSAERGRRDDMVAQATADAEGRYRLAFSRNFPSWSDDRRVMLLAHAPGYAPITGEVPLRGWQQQTNLHLPIQAGVQGRLLGPDGTPAVGVRLAVVRLGHIARETIQGNDPPPTPPGWPADVLSDGTGNFRLDGLPSGESIWLQVQDDRFALTTFQVSAGAAEQTAVTLAGPRVLTGRIFAEDTGRPMGGARVTVIVGTERKNRDHYTALAVNPAAAPPLEVDGRADADGWFVLRLPPDESYHIYFKPPPGCAYIGRFWRMAWREGETPHKMLVGLPAGVEVHGQVVEEDGRPIDGACVTYAATGFRTKDDHDSDPERFLFSSTETLTGADGRFRFAVPTGPCVLRVFGPTADYRLHDYTPTPCPVCGQEDVRGFEHARVTVDLTPGTRPEALRLTLRRGTTVAGRAIGPDGIPIRTGVLVCRAVAQPLRSVMPRTFLIHDGAFALPGCIPGRVYPVLLLDAAQQLATACEVQVPTDGKPPTVRLAACGTAVVRLVDAAGRPLVGRRPFVQFWLDYDRPAGDSDPISAGRRPRTMDASWVDPRHYLPGPATDANGRVVLPDLIPGLEYCVSFPGAGSRVFSTKVFRAASGVVLELPDVVAPLDESNGHAGHSP
jgi:hypothetical protein